MAEEAPPQPLIDPTHFDLIVSGTGLPESILAASASAAGKSVLHVDSNPFYGSHFASLSFPSLLSLLQLPPPPLQPKASDEVDGGSVPVSRRSIYSDVEISGALTLEPYSRSFSLDLAGPRVLYCSDPAVEMMLKSGASHHLEFKSVLASLIYLEGKLHSVPDSREAIFRDKSLGLAEKNRMMRFIRLVTGHIGSDGGGGLPDEDAEVPMAEFLDRQGLSAKIKSIILYAIVMADYDQDNAEVCKKLIKTKDGIQRLVLYNSSVSRFPNAVGAFIYPIYGQGVLPQAFCRCAAVKGAIYVLRMPVTGLLVDKETRQYKGVRLSSGQDIFSHHLVMDPSFIAQHSLFSTNASSHHEDPEVPKAKECQGLSSSTTKVARAICITKGSIRPDSSNLLVIFPPRSLGAEQLTAVRALQLSSDVAVCPPDVFVIYFSTLCDDAIQGKKHLHAAMNAILLHSYLNDSQNSTSTVSEDSEGETKPTLMWSALYVQEFKEASLEPVCSCPMPDGNLDYGELLEATIKLFHHMYPQEEIFAKPPPTEDNEEDDGSLE
ncbi:hypothetical protein QJS10_CPA10g00025 [Acorus calamus]|uniref:Rab escort protein 1 n=1 Tax=Acorus calamus TaxID=4465 RepID=A0AAV9E0E5_ACOCL|nr:hypothetical protein QJS10_CPA10g00025 [Acorus calamus]